MHRSSVTLLRRLAAPFAAAAVLLSTTGCGPVLSTVKIISAQAELDGARAAQGEKFAPYEMTAAENYLAKAREEQGYAEFGPSIDYASRAETLAIEGRKRAMAQQRVEAPPAAPSTDDGGAAPAVRIQRVAPTAPAEANKPQAATP